MAETDWSKEPESWRALTFCKGVGLTPALSAGITLGDLVRGYAMGISIAKGLGMAVELLQQESVNLRLNESTRQQLSESLNKLSRLEGALSLFPGGGDDA